MKIAAAFLTVLVMFYTGADVDGLKCFICNLDQCDDEAQNCDGVCGGFLLGSDYKMGRFCALEEVAISVCQYLKDEVEEHGSYCYYCKESECNKELPKGYVFGFVNGLVGRLG